ncbi:MAG TPA: hypothetical protein DCQ83_02670 [Fibrobacteres bacterium]|nr:hypothetical protein [Fibrobacterota bacterium]
MGRNQPERQIRGGGHLSLQRHFRLLGRTGQGDRGAVRFPSRLAASLLPTGLPLPVIRGPARGGIWLTGAAPGPSKGLSVLWNRSEPEQLEAAARLSDNATCCFDIGAHSGLYSLVFSRRAKRVCAFEPLPRNIAWLMRTLSWNHVSNTTVLPWAVAGETGFRTFQEGAHSSMGRLDSTGDIHVFATTLREFITREQLFPEVIKIDVEGAEAEVLRGGLEFLRERKPALLLSVHGTVCRNECLELLKGLGYSRIQPLDMRGSDDADSFRIES